MSEIVITGTLCYQHKKLLISATISLKDLLSVYEVDIWKMGRPIEEQGCQREPIQTHYKKLGRQMRDDEELLLPQSLLLSGNIKTGDESDKYSFRLENDGDVVRVIIPEGHKLRVVDGQHRVKGSEYAITELDQIALEDNFNFPIVIMIPDSRSEEIRSFLQINTKGRKVSTDLALHLLNELEKSKDSSLTKADQWQVIALKVAMLLNNDPKSPWHQTIYMGSKGDTGLLTATSFVKSMRPVLYQIRFIKKDLESQGADTDKVAQKIANLLNKYWNAIRRAIPGAFPEELTERLHWSIQKNVGVRVWHILAPFILEECMVMREKVKDITEVAIFKFLEKYSGYGVTDFEGVWSSKSGDAVSAASTKYYTEIASMIQNDIQENYINQDNTSVTY
jgi:DGQHR domain-containing protein